MGRYVFDSTLSLDRKVVAAAKRTASELGAMVARTDVGSMPLEATSTGCGKTMTFDRGAVKGCGMTLAT